MHILQVINSIVCLVLVVTMVLSFLIFCLKKRRKEQVSGLMFNKSFLSVSYAKLREATDEFSPTNLIGVGRFCSVYKGILDPDETVVAVKVLNLRRRGASKSFKAECKALRNIRHRNLVKIVTVCSSIDFQGNEFKAIVYEYMPHGSLESWLHSTRETNNGQSEPRILNLHHRLSIAIDVACALDYLHHQCVNRIIHCDLKPSNILLDRDMVARVGDFGLARFIPQRTNPHQSSSSAAIRGSYVAPEEYGIGNEVSTKGDVYSYGILLLEMMTGRRPTDAMFEGGLNIHNYARMALSDNIMKILDPVLLMDVAEHATEATNGSSSGQEKGVKIKECMTFLVKIGISCSMESPQVRMNIRDVIPKLQSFGKIFEKIQ